METLTGTTLYEQCWDDAIDIWRHNFSGLIEKLELVAEDWTEIPLSEVLKNISAEELAELRSLDNMDWAVGDAYDLRREWQAAQRDELYEERNNKEAE